MLTLTPDDWILFRIGPLPVNATIGFTWVVMAVLVSVAAVLTRRLSTAQDPPRRQLMLEGLVLAMRDQVAEVSQQAPGRYLPFVGTLFLFIATANALALLPGFRPPTASLSTTVALALCVFVAVPLFGIAKRGLLGYLRHYIRPTPLMLPFNVLGELSRTLALAVRLYGNMMSGTVLVAILLAIAPFFFPVALQLLGLLTGMIQAYIFAVLAMVYIASATTAATAASPDRSDA